MSDTETPNRASNMQKAEGDRMEGPESPEQDRWSSDPNTVERQDRDRPESGADADESGTRDR
jgi:hypothetical protein